MEPLKEAPKERMVPLEKYMALEAKLEIARETLRIVYRSGTVKRILNIRALLERALKATE